MPARRSANARSVIAWGRGSRLSARHAQGRNSNDSVICGEWKSTRRSPRQSSRYFRPTLKEVHDEISSTGHAGPHSVRRLLWRSMPQMRGGTARAISALHWRLVLHLRAELPSRRQLLALSLCSRSGGSLGAGQSPCRMVQRRRRTDLAIRAMVFRQRAGVIDSDLRDGCRCFGGSCR